jgi:hypothetical protein
VQPRTIDHRWDRNSPLPNYSNSLPALCRHASPPLDSSPSDPVHLNFTMTERKDRLHNATGVAHHRVMSLPHAYENGMNQPSRDQLSVASPSGVDPNSWQAFRVTERVADLRRLCVAGRLGTCTSTWRDQSAAPGTTGGWVGVSCRTARRVGCSSMTMTGSTYGSAAEDLGQESAARCVLLLRMSGTAISAGHAPHHRIDMLSATGPCPLAAPAAVHCSAHVLVTPEEEGSFHSRLYPAGYS